MAWMISDFRQNSKNTCCPRRIILSIGAIWAYANAAFAEPGKLDVSIRESTATIRSSDDGRQLIRLPELTFAVSIEAHCDAIDGVHGDVLRDVSDNAQGNVESVSISVSDTHTTISGDEFSERQIVETELRIPRRQIAPMAVDGVCQNRDEFTSQFVKGALTAHASLNCTLNGERSIIYQTIPVDVVVTCESGIAVDPSQVASGDND